MTMAMPPWLYRAAEIIVVGRSEAEGRVPLPSEVSFDGIGVN